MKKEREPSGKRNIRTFLLSIVLLVAGFGCASTPKVTPIIEEVPAVHEPPEIASVRGFLPPSESRVIIAGLERATGSTDLLERQTNVMQAVSEMPLIEGNKVTLLVDGPATYDAMFEAIRSAKNHINLETFLFSDDATGRAFAELLLLKRSEGVQVNVIYDSVGSLCTSASLFDRLRDGGIEVLQFNPINPFKARDGWRPLKRDHRKLLVVDGKVAIMGGMNISGVYSGGISGISQEKEGLPWRDTDIQIEGPAVAECQRLFLDTWKAQKGPELPKMDYFPSLSEAGKDLVQVLGSESGKRRRVTFIMYVSAIVFAKKTIHLTTAYFVPDEQALKSLIGAASRGVDVKIILPKRSDEPIAVAAGRYYYSDLLKKGIKIYERRSAMLHAKTAVIDGVWSTVGSTNMDYWSFLHDNELNAVILSRDFAGKMEELFDWDLSKSDEIRWEKWKERPRLPRVWEWFMHLFAHFL
jgi:cardiolipin synthase